MGITKTGYLNNLFSYKRYCTGSMFFKVGYRRNTQLQLFFFNSNFFI